MCEIRINAEIYTSLTWHNPQKEKIIGEKNMTDIRRKNRFSALLQRDENRSQAATLVLQRISANHHSFE